VYRQASLAPRDHQPRRLALTHHRPPSPSAGASIHSFLRSHPYLIPALMSAAQMSSKRPRDAPDDGAESDASSSSSGYRDFEGEPTASRFLPPSMSTRVGDGDDDGSLRAGYDGPVTRTMQTEVGQENVGYGLLVKMGWKGAGTGLGPEGEGA
jgi:hypothetical protein